MRYEGLGEEGKGEGVKKGRAVYVQLVRKSRNTHFDIGSGRSFYKEHKIGERRRQIFNSPGGLEVEAFIESRRRR